MIRMGIRFACGPGGRGLGWGSGRATGRRKKQIPRGNDRKKSKGKCFDAKGAKVARSRHVTTGSGRGG